MAEQSKRYYWLKLKRDFFKRHDIQIIESMPNGKDYVLFYLKLLVESVDHEGGLRFSDTIPYNEQMLATVTNTNVDIVHRAMEIFQRLNLVEILDDQTIYMEEIQKMTGSEGWSTQRVRDFRAKKASKALPCNTDETDCNDQETKSKSKSKSKSIEIDITPDEPAVSRSKTNYSLVRDLFIAHCPSLPQPTPAEKWTSTRKNAVRSKDLSPETFAEVFDRVEQSDFLTGRNGKWEGGCSFDWILKPANWQKIIEGTYDNRRGSKPAKSDKSTYDIEAYEKLSMQVPGSEDIP